MNDSETKPIFNGEFVAFSDFDREALRLLLRAVDAQRVLEVGSWLGSGSTQELATMCAKVYCADHWLGNPNVLRHKQLVADFDVFATFLKNVERYGNRIQPMRMSSEKAAILFDDGYFDLVFIDADHSYESTLLDIRLWRSKVRSGGILCGHDCEGRPNDYGRARLEQGKALDTIESDRFPRIHPGCILAIDEAFSGGANLFSETELALADGRKGFSTIWHVTT